MPDNIPKGVKANIEAAKKHCEHERWLKVRRKGMPQPARSLALAMAKTLRKHGCIEGILDNQYLWWHHPDMPDWDYPLTETFEGLGLPCGLDWKEVWRILKYKASVQAKHKG